MVLSKNNVVLNTHKLVHAKEYNYGTITERRVQSTRTW